MMPDWLVARNLLDDKNEEIDSLRSRLADLKDKNRWIPVGERLPENGTEALLICNGYVVIGTKDPGGWVDREAKEEWDRKTAQEMKRRGEVPQNVENDLSKSTDRTVISTKSTDPAEVRLCPTVELGPETMKALKDMIETAIRELVNVKVQAPVAIKPEVIQAAKEGDRYRAQAQERLGRGW